MNNTEQLTLPSGLRISVGPVGPDDKPAFLEGFHKLSAHSRRQRFLFPKKQLSAEDLRLLTECDGLNHYAIGASFPGVDGEKAAPVAAARFVRDEHNADKAEFALTVVDEWQNHGVGRLMVSRLFEAARERAVTTMRGDIMASNTPMLGLLRDYVDRGRRVEVGGVIEVQFPII